MNTWLEGARCVLVSAALMVGLAIPPLAAEEASPQNGAEGAFGRQVAQRAEELRRLKAENLAEFQRLVGERKARIKERLRELKETDPERFREVRGKMIQHRREHLQKIRQENPEKFQELMQQRMQRLRTLREENPERFQEFLKNHPRAAHWLDKEGRDGGRWDRLEDIRDRREDFRDRGLHRGEELGVRDHGAGIGRGKGQGFHRRDTRPGGSARGPRKSD